MIGKGMMIQLTFFPFSHDGPVWQVAWAHPKFGGILASCSYDGKAIIYREEQPNNWVQLHNHAFHQSSGTIIYVETFTHMSLPTNAAGSNNSEFHCLGSL